MKIFKRSMALFAMLSAVIAATIAACHKDASVSTNIWIHRPPKAVWHILMDTNAYPSWNPIITRIDGQLRVGHVFKFVNGSGDNAMTFRPTVLVLNKDHELRWRGYVLFPGIFEGTHSFYLAASGNGTQLVQHEVFTGLLVGRLTKDVLRKTATGMQALNVALKNRAESLSPAPASAVTTEADEVREDATSSGLIAMQARR